MGGGGGELACVRSCSTRCAPFSAMLRKAEVSTEVMVAWRAVVGGIPVLSCGVQCAVRGAGGVGEGTTVGAADPTLLTAGALEVVVQRAAGSETRCRGQVL